MDHLLLIELSAFFRVISPLLGMYFENVCFLSFAYLLIFVMVPFEVQKF